MPRLTIRIVVWPGGSGWFLRQPLVAPFTKTKITTDVVVDFEARETGMQPTDVTDVSTSSLRKNVRMLVGTFGLAAGWWPTINAVNELTDLATRSTGSPLLAFGTLGTDHLFEQSHPKL